MHWQYTPLILPFLASALIVAMLAVYARKNITLPCARTFAYTTMLISLWCVAGALEILSTTLPEKVFWVNVQYFSFVTIPLAWLSMTLDYTGRGLALFRRRLPLLLVIPTLTILLIWTTDLHGLMRTNVYLDSSGPIAVMVKAYGPWFWVHAAYSYLLVLASAVLLLWAVFTTPRVYRKQPLALLTATLISMLGSVTYVSGFTSFDFIDVTPLVMGAAGLIVTWALFRGRLFNVVPIAHDKVVEGMSDGVIVLSARGHLLGLNPAAESTFGLRSAAALGQKATEIFAPWPGLSDLLTGSGNDKTELVIGSGGPGAGGIDSDAEKREGIEKRCYEVQVSTLADKTNYPVGKVVVLRDITQRKQQEERLAYLADHDPLTGLLNRRLLEAAVTRAVARARRDRPSALLYVDADNFKVINDKQGHAVGDKVLVKLASLLRGELREQDVIARLGGDEFGILLTDANIKTAWQIADRLCAAVDAGPFSVDGLDFKLSLSVGIVSIDGEHNASQLLSLADTAMYKAKDQGRDCSAVYTEMERAV